MSSGAVQGMRAEEAVRDRERDVAVEQHAAQKAAVEAERGRVAAERAAAKEAQRQRMVAVMEAKYLEVSGAWHSLPPVSYAHAPPVCWRV